MKQEEITKLTDKISKLIKLQGGAKEIGSLEEAAAAASRIQVLLLKHNLELSDLKLEKGEEGPVATNTRINLEEEFNWTKSSGPWMTNLIGLLAIRNLCGIVIVNRPNKNYTANIPDIMLFGEKHNIEIVSMLAAQLIHRLKRMAAQSFKEYTGFDKKNAYYRGYLQGAVNGINTKMQEAKKELELEHSGITALVVSSDKLVKNAIEDYFKGNLKKQKSRRSSSVDGLVNGFKDGKNMSINKALN